MFAVMGCIFGFANCWWLWVFVAACWLFVLICLCSCLFAALFVLIAGF